MMRATNLFISPHLDDAALSCGGLIHRLAREGERVVIVTVASADKPAGVPVSWLMRRSHLAWRLGNTPFAVRRWEDVAAAETLGADYLHLGMVDAIYRLDSNDRPLYPTSTVAVPIHPSDLKCYRPYLSRRLQDLLRVYGSGSLRVFCPLGAGQHIDHIVAREAVEASCLPSIISYYEDFPYARRTSVVRARLSRVAWPETWIQSSVVLSPDEVEARIRAVACYNSQLHGLFPSPLERLLEVIRARAPQLPRFLDRHPRPQASRERMASALRRYIAEVGGERYWRREDSSEGRLAGVGLAEGTWRVDVAAQDGSWAVDWNESWSRSLEA